MVRVTAMVERRSWGIMRIKRAKAYMVRRERFPLTAAPHPSTEVRKVPIARARRTQRTKWDHRGA